MQFTIPPATHPTAVATNGRRPTHAKSANRTPISTHDAACDEAMERMKVHTRLSLWRAFLSSLCIAIAVVRVWSDWAPAESHMNKSPPAHHRPSFRSRPAASQDSLCPKAWRYRRSGKAPAKSISPTSTLRGRNTAAASLWAAPRFRRHTL